jgi:molecular chaperone DnaK
VTSARECADRWRHDTAAITTASEELAKVSQTLGQAVYAQNEAAGAGTPDGAAGGTDARSDDDVVDAEIVDEPPAAAAG